MSKKESSSNRHVPELLDVLAKEEKRFRSFLSNRTGDTNEAEEVFQNAFLKASENIDTIRNKNKIISCALSTVKCDTNRFGAMAKNFYGTAKF